MKITTELVTYPSCGYFPQRGYVPLIYVNEETLGRQTLGVFFRSGNNFSTAYESSKCFHAEMPLIFGAFLVFTTHAALDYW